METLISLFFVEKNGELKLTLRGMFIMFLFGLILFLSTCKLLIMRGY